MDGKIIRLFHPRQDVWQDHFEWHKAGLFGKTAIARTTIQALGINDADAVLLRETLVLEGLELD